MTIFCQPLIVNQRINEYSLYLVKGGFFYE